MKNLVCAASFSLIDLDQILDAKNESDIWGAHNSFEDDETFDEYYEKRVPFSVNMSEIMRRKSDDMEIVAKVLSTSDRNADCTMSFHIQETMFLISGEYDASNKEFIANSDTCACDAEETIGTEIDLSLIETITFFVEA